MITMLLSEDNKKAQARHNAISKEIEEGRNLSELLREVDEAISLADESIIKAILGNQAHASLNAFKNELWSLKFKILERPN